MDYVYELQEEAYFLRPYEPMLIKHKPSHYLRMAYLDCVCYHPPAARCASETMGADLCCLAPMRRPWMRSRSAA